MLEIYFKTLREEEIKKVDEIKPGCWIHVNEATTDDLHKIMQHVLTDEESVISWAENVKLFTDELKNHIVTPRYAYLWQLEGFVCDKRVEGLVNEYNVKSRASWTSSRQHFTG